MRKVSRSAFTLVELLVVIGIIAVLISVLMPALSRARAAAWRTKCMSNHQQLMLAMHLYVNETGGRIPPLVMNNTGTPAGAMPWYHTRFLGKYIGNNREPVAPEATTINRSKISRCSLLGPPDYDRLGIGMNACWGNGIFRTGNSATSAMYKQIKEPWKTLMFIDIRERGSDNTSYTFEQFYQGDTTASWAGSNRVVAYRHAKQTVVSFADGHVETFKSAFNDWESTQYNQGLHAALLAKRVKWKAGRVY